MYVMRLAIRGHADDRQRRHITRLLPGLRTGTDCGDEGIHQGEYKTKGEKMIAVYLIIGGVMFAALCVSVRDMRNAR